MYDYGKKIRLVAIIAATLIYCIPFATMVIGGRGLLLWLGTAFLVLTIFQAFTNPNNLSMDGIGLLVVFFIYVFFTSLWSPSGNMFEVFKTYMVTFLLCVNKYRRKEQILILAASVLSAMTVAIYIATGHGGFVADSERIAIDFFGEYQDPNYMSIVFFPSISIATWCIVKYKNIIVKIVSILSILLLSFAELLMGCRGGLFTCLFVMLITIVMYYKVSFKVIVSLSFVALALYFVAPFFLNLLPDSVAFRFSIEGISGDDAGGRIPIWQKTLKVISDSPLLLICGYGTGSSQALIGGATHNFPLQLILEEGFIGLGLFVTFCIKKFIKFWEEQNILAFAILAGTLFMSLSLSVMGIQFFWMVLSVALLLSNNEYQIENV